MRFRPGDLLLWRRAAAEWRGYFADARLERVMLVLEVTDGSIVTLAIASDGSTRRSAIGSGPASRLLERLGGG